MHYVRIPEAVKVGKDEEGREAPKISLKELFDQIVWTNGFWRVGKDNRCLCRSLEDKFEDKEPGAVIELTDTEFEALFPIVTLKGKDLDSKSGRAVMKLMDAFIFADTKPPKEN